MPTPFPPNASRILLRRGCRPKACAVIKQPYPELTARVGPILGQPTALTEARVTPDNPLQVAITRGNSPKIHLNQAVLEGARQVQAELKNATRPSPKPSKTNNQQPSIPRLPSPWLGEG
jgi:hypothetical protein